MPLLASGSGNVGVVLGAIRSSVQPVARRPEQAGTAPPFVTISREAGAGARGIGEALARLLTQRDPARPWKCYDRELVEQVAADHRIDQSIVEALEESSHSWVKELFGSLAGDESSDAFRAVRRTAATIRALAQVGHAIIVGRGGAFVTARMAGGVHVRLIAPLETRVRQYAALNRLELDEARRRIAELDANRVAFRRRYWPNQADDPLVYTLTINTAGLTETQLAESIAALAPPRG